MVFRIHCRNCAERISLSRAHVCVLHTQTNAYVAQRRLSFVVSIYRFLCVHVKQYNRTAFTEESLHRMCVYVVCVKHRNKNRDKFNWEMSTTMTFTTDTNTQLADCWIKITTAAPMTKPTSIWYGLCDKLFTTIIYNAYHLNFSFTHDNYRFYWINGDWVTLSQSNTSGTFQAQPVSLPNSDTLLIHNVSMTHKTKKKKQEK